MSSDWWTQPYMSRDSPPPPKTASLWPGRMEGCGKSPAHTEGKGEERE